MKQHLDMQKKYENYIPEMDKMQMKYDESLELSISLQGSIQNHEKEVQSLKMGLADS